MRKALMIGILAAAAASAGCSHDRGEKDSGPVVSRAYEVGNFDQVEVTGPFDVIVRLEADDLDKLGNAITDGIQHVEGVQRTTTCLAVKLG